ncbi:cobalt transporter [Oleomonas cavernae]|uniref:Cobalt transporter n=1 Tax=Oleomonas cavernae TaxID=2320859 RepID=A0A418WT30_9PROT|nr:CbtA family protein [Oleomonas cavernae]RJF94398.1 cobalt transporter [Oleomonas cavernae]
MFGRLAACGLAGGILGGCLVAAIQAVTTTPLILHAELFEVHEVADAAGIILAHAHGTASDAVAHADGYDTTRLFMTSIMTVVCAIGYGWILLSAMYLKGAAITARSILPWAIAAFVATGLAPSLGLAPELPGSAAADLDARQLWWAGTALATAVGIALIAFSRNPLWIVAALVLIVLPHIIGAPVPPDPESRVPAEVAAEFAGASLVVQFLAWVIPGAIAGFLAQRLIRPEPVAA